jgi:PKD repeat protein
VIVSYRSDIRAGIVCFIFALSGWLFATTAWPADRQILRRHVPEGAKNLPSLARLESTNRLNLAIGLPLRNQEALTNLLQDIYNPASANYRQYLTPQQFTAKFGPTERDYQEVIAFAKGKGLRVITTHPNRMVLDVEGAVTDIEKAFNVRMQVYRHPREERTFFSPNAEPSLDLAATVLHISGLDNFTLPRPKRRLMGGAAAGGQVVAKSGSGQAGSYMGNDFRTAYLPGVTLTGTGQAVGLLQFDGYNATDISMYESEASLPSVPLQDVLLDDFPGRAGPGNTEVALDIQMVVSMAPGLSQVIVYEGTLGASILSRMATDNAAKQLSCSWSFPVDDTCEQMFQEFAAQGQSFFDASGDDDAFVDAVPTPDDDLYVTIVGGTTLTTGNSGGAWVSETTWNWGGGVGSGGGVSTSYPIPSWQMGISMSANHGSTAMRNVPDVALIADKVYSVADNGISYTNVAGTSCAAPLWAGLTALINEQAAAKGLPTVGFLNPAIYALGKSANYTNCFRDITTGDNTSPSSPSQFHAVAGYDLCTGWGTPKGTNLINALAMVDALSITPVAGLSANGPAGGPFNTMTGKFFLTNSVGGTLTWSLNTTSTWLTASVTNGTLTKGGSGKTVTVSLAPSAGDLYTGTYQGIIWFSNQTSGTTQGRAVALSIGQSLVQNGGFEDGSLTWWTQSGNMFGADIGMGPISVHSGGYGARLGTMQALGYLSQSLETRIGQQYEVSCWVDSSDGRIPNEFVLEWNGDTLFDQANMGATGWNNLQYVVTATDSNTVLKFGFRDDPSYLGLDDISVVEIDDNPPTMSLDPTNQTVSVGGTAMFASSAWGSRPIFYRWQRNSANLPNATNANLTLSGITTNQAGTYRVVISNLYGSVTSSSAILTVNAPVTTATFTASPTNGMVPMAVTFTDTSSGTITNRNWTFGDGVSTNKAGATVVHTYTTAGSFDVRLTISGPVGAATNIQTNCIVTSDPMGNGIPPSAWIQQYYPGTNDYTNAAASDTDGDGMTAWQEYLAGTDPTDRSSCLSVAITNSAGKVVVKVPSVRATGSNYVGLTRYYAIEQCSNSLWQASWQGAPGYTGISANGNVIACTNTIQFPFKFYRVKAWLR